MGQDGAITGLYEIADNFSAPRALASAEAVQTPHQKLVFPIIQSAGSRLTEVCVFNPNALPVNLRLAGFTSLGNRVEPTDSSGRPVSSLTLPAFGTLVVSSTRSSSIYDVHLPFNNLDGGYIAVQTTDGQGIVGGETFSEVRSGGQSLSLLNGLPSPSGCLPSTMEPFGCHTDDSPDSPVPSAIRQHTLYAMYVEANPADPILCLVNVSDSPAQVAVSAFSESGQFRATSPSSGFLTINPHQMVQASVLSLFGFNPSSGYIRVEDPNSAFVGGIINRVNGAYTTAVPIPPDDPRLTQTATTTFFSRIQLDPPSADPRLTTGVLIFNPNNNPVQFTITITDSRGAPRRSPTQRLAARGVFVRARQSLTTLFPNVNVSGGFAHIGVTGDLEPGMGGLVIPVAVYRASNWVSAVPPQNKQPE